MFPVEREKKWLKSVHQQGNWALVFKQTFEVNYDIGSMDGLSQIMEKLRF